MSKLIDEIEIAETEVPLGWSVKQLREQHKAFLKKYLYDVIRRYGLIVAQLREQKRALAKVTGEAEARQPAKRARQSDAAQQKVTSQLSSLLGRESSRARGIEEDSPADIINKEIQFYLGLDDSETPNYDDLPDWWYNVARKNMPCLSQVASAFLASKPSAGGLECNLGGMTDVIAPKRSSLRAGLVEINLFLKLNKDLIETNPSKVTQITRKDVDKHIPSRPIMREYDSSDEDSDNEAAVCAYDNSWAEEKPSFCDLEDGNLPYIDGSNAMEQH